MTNFTFQDRLIGTEQDNENKLKFLEEKDIDSFIGKVIPRSIKDDHVIGIGDGLSEADYLLYLKENGKKNVLYNTFIGQGFYGTVMPSPIQRNMLENPSWYTSYTPYQAEISQGRLEALLNFQTMIIEMTGMEVANASLLDEASAASEAMLMLFNARKRDAIKRGVNKIFVDRNVFKQNVDVVYTKAIPLGIEVVIGNYDDTVITDEYFAVLIQYPNSKGAINKYRNFTANASEIDAGVIVIADILALSLLTPPGEWGADVVVGSVQRLGLPMGFGGPHAAFFATKESFVRKIPGRIIGVSQDVNGNRALRMALQTREQHIKREKATSNICTAQALLANMAGMYAVYHGKEGIVAIAENINKLASCFAIEIQKLGFHIVSENFFDTVFLNVSSDIIAKLRDLCFGNDINLYFEKEYIGVSFDETKSIHDVEILLRLFSEVAGVMPSKLESACESMLDLSLKRETDFLTAPVFKKYRTEHEFMRYIKKLEKKDISLTHSMISLGSCTMKLNSATSMFALSWGEYANIHPFVPSFQSAGYHNVISELEDALCKITGFDAVTFQPNSGATGEYTGLLIIREYHKKNNNAGKNIILIPASAHGTNPASAIVAGMDTVTILCDESGNINIADLQEKATMHAEKLAGFMVTYPSTHGVFEDEILEMTKIIHENGGLVYMDGANMNAQVGLTSPVKIGADLCHLNLHKTFGIPHGGGGPGVGPVLVKAFLSEFLPSHPCFCDQSNKTVRAIAAAPYGNANVLLISHAYVKLLGDKGLKNATMHAILNANYIAKALGKYFPVLYTGSKGYVAHELILDCREFKKTAGIEVVDIAKRLIDFGYHAPTVSFPVAGTLMIEPTESESIEELDRFIEAMITIRQEIKDIENGVLDKINNPLKNAPHTESVVAADEYPYPYSRAKAAFPLDWIRENKYWAPVSRVNDALGDRNLVCSCIS